VLLVVVALAGVAEGEGNSADVTITASGSVIIDHYAVTHIGPQMAGTAFSVTIQAQDASNNDITSGVDAAENITISFGLPDAGATPLTTSTSGGTATVSMTMTVAQTGQSITFTGDASGKFGTSNLFDVNNTPVGTNVTVILDGVTVVFGNVTGEGITSLSTATSTPCDSSFTVMLPGYRVVGPIYHITTTATYIGADLVTVYLTYDPSGILTQGDLRMFHCHGGIYGKDVTISVNTGAHIVGGQDTVLSWWLIVDPPDGGYGGGLVGVPVFPNIYVGMAAAVGASILAYFVRRRLIDQHR
jgi:hypothetical protein